MDYGNVEAQNYDLRPGVRKTFDRAFIYEISDEYDFAFVRDSNFDDADAAYFKLAAECRRRGRDKLRRRARAVAPQDDLIVGDKLYHVVQKSADGASPRQRNARSDFPDPEGPRISTPRAAHRDCRRMDALNLVRQILLLHTLSAEGGR